MVASEILPKWRQQDPPGRFLKCDENTRLWHDIGDKKARKKIGKALKEQGRSVSLSSIKFKDGKPENTRRHWNAEGFGENLPSNLSSRLAMELSGKLKGCFGTTPRKV
jgi:hypothetical protein